MYELYISMLKTDIFTCDFSANNLRISSAGNFRDKYLSNLKTEVIFHIIDQKKFSEEDLIMRTHIKW